MKNTKNYNKSTTIHCHAPEATSVCVAGSFNEWDPTAAPMKHSKTGKWSIRLNLPSGKHEYKFVVDGDWRCDPECAGEKPCANCILNDLGTMNRILEVM